MRGLKTQENNKFKRFFQIIQNSAQKLDSVFFAYAGDGRDIILPDLEGEDMMGWLIPMAQADQFEDVWTKDNSEAALEQWSQYFVWAEWSNNDGVITITFNSYEQNVGAFALSDGRSAAFIVKMHFIQR